ncbi:MAG: altronate dehydratase family protein [Lachnospiraceae bacterium]|nr:altronate dehydratase family protein [Lachnospiraceae bacterium]
MNTMKIHQSDNVILALEDISAGCAAYGDGISLVTKDTVPRGHKIAVRDLKEGDPVIKYGAVIGIAAKDISTGEHVHVHNVKTALSGQREFSYQPFECELPKREHRSFQGYIRKDGSVGIRNEIWILPTVGCVGSAAKRLAEENKDLIKGSIDGIHAFVHPYGCSQMGEDHETTGKILAALARHPNAGGVLILSLGCENLTHEQMKEKLGDYDPERIRFLCCQECEDEMQEGRKILQELSEYASAFHRESVDAQELIVGVKCGGSDGLSGITANPAVGGFSDMLIEMGGSTVLSEVPEMFGAEEMLLSRCKDRDTFDRAVKMIRDFKEYYIRHGQVIYENPSPGNKAGGITTLEDKSCGCVQKGGGAAVSDVLSYGEGVKSHGLSLLSGPGNDLVSTTALTAAGAHLILFTTGRGTPFGAPVPTIKIASNTRLFESKPNWIDCNAGSIADGTQTLKQVSEMLLEKVLSVSSGEQTKQELGNNREIAIWKNGVTL